MSLENKKLKCCICATEISKNSIKYDPYPYGQSGDTSCFRCYTTLVVKTQVALLNQKKNFPK